MSDLVNGRVFTSENLRDFLQKIKRYFQPKNKEINEDIRGLISFNQPIYIEINTNTVYDNNTPNRITNVLSNTYEKYKEIILYTKTGNINLNLSGTGWKSNKGQTVSGGKTIIKIEEGFHTVNLNFNSKVAIIKKYQ